jgi:hypothetical protein
MSAAHRRSAERRDVMDPATVGALPIEYVI